MPTVLLFSLLVFLHPLEATSGHGVDLGGFGVWFGGSNGGSGIVPPSASDPSFSTSYTALQAWKASVTEDPNGILTTWVGPNVCSYKGVFCSDPPEESTSTDDKVVAVVDLNRAFLKGMLVEELSLLTHLSALHLNSNKFWGAIPNSFSNLQYLIELDLSNNMFAGPFPKPTLAIPNLAYLDLRFNRFAGAIPGELFEKRLDAILLNNNMFDGQIPMSLWSSPASVVNFANNEFAGDLPSTFSYVGSGLREVIFLNNMLTGCIPEGVGLLTSMEVLDFSFNSFTGHLPSSVSCLSDIEVLNIAHNQISGVLSDMLCSLRSLVNLTISYNFFSGFSEGCTAKPFLGFDFSGNCIPGRVMQRPLPECEVIPGIGQVSCFRMPSTGALACNRPMGTTTITEGSSLTVPQMKIPSIP